MNASLLAAIAILLCCHCNNAFHLWSEQSDEEEKGKQSTHVRSDDVRSSPCRRIWMMRDEWLYVSFNLHVISLIARGFAFWKRPFHTRTFIDPHRIHLALSILSIKYEYEEHGNWAANNEKKYWQILYTATPNTQDLCKLHRDECTQPAYPCTINLIGN